MSEIRRGHDSGRGPGARLPVILTLACLGLGLGLGLGLVAPAVGALPAPAHPPTPRATTASPLPPAGSPVGTISTVDHTGIGRPGAMVTAANGDLWFLNELSIGRITPAGAVTIFHDPGIDHPQGLAAGADGNLWYTNMQGSVGRLTPSGTVTTFAVEGNPHAIVAGADGALWFYTAFQDANAAVLRITTTGSLSSPGLGGPFDGYADGVLRRLAAGADGSIWYEVFDGWVRRYHDGVVDDVNGSQAGPGDLRVRPIRTVVTPDGNLWFTNQNNSIGRLTPTGTVTIFDDPSIQDPGEITVGPDSALWFTNGTNGIGRITTAGAVTVFADAGIDGPDGVTSGTDGALWFSNGLGSSIGRMTTAGVVTATFTHPGITAPTAVATGSDGNLWFTDAAHSIGRTTPEGTVTMFSDPSIRSPRALVRGGDGALWYLNANAPSAAIGRVSTDGTVTTFAGPTIYRTDVLAAAPDGTLWFSDGSFGQARLWHLTTTGQVMSVEPPSGVLLLPTEQALDIAVDSGNNIWLTAAAEYTNQQGTVRTKEVLRVSPAVVVTRFALSDLDSPTGITAHGDDTVSFVLNGNVIMRLTPTATMTKTAELAPGTTIHDLVDGADGSLWFTSETPFPSVAVGTRVSRLTQAGALVAFQDPSLRAPTSITPGPDGALWFANTAGPTIGRITTTISAAFHAVTPTRLLDSRTATGNWNGPLTAGTPKDLVVTGAVVPATASAVVVNVTATGSTAGSYLQAWATGEPTPAISDLNFGAGQTIPNLATLPVGMGGAISFATNTGSTHVIVDVVGYYDDGSGPGALFTPLTPVRALDSRTTTGGWNGPLDSGSPRDLVIRRPEGVPSVPPGATAVVTNITVTDSTAGSYLTAWAADAPQPETSNLNFGAGQTIANLAVLPLSTDGQVRLATNTGSTHVVVDIIGAFDPSAGLRFHPVPPHRVLDDRVGHGAQGPWTSGLVRAVTTAEPAVAASGASAQLLNVTATNATAGSYLSVFATAGPVPGTSTVNFAAGETIANLTIARLDADGRTSIRNHTGTVDVVADTTGFYGAT